MTSGSIASRAAVLGLAAFTPGVARATGGGSAGFEDRVLNASMEAARTMTGNNDIAAAALIFFTMTAVSLGSIPFMKRFGSAADASSGIKPQ